MPRRRLEEEHENHERWLVSYADFITLLFAFFVVMYAMSSVNEGKYRVLSDSMVAAFKDPEKIFEPMEFSSVVSSPAVLSSPFPDPAASSADIAKQVIDEGLLDLELGQSLGMQSDSEEGEDPPTDTPPGGGDGGGGGAGKTLLFQCGYSSAALSHGEEKSV